VLLTLIRHPAAGDGAYRSTEHGIWLPSENREVPVPLAASLLADFPGCFTVAQAPQDAPGDADARRATVAPVKPQTVPEPRRDARRRGR